MTPGEAVTAAISTYAELVPRPLNIVETGSIRGEGKNYERNDGWSTLYIARWVKDHGGKFFSIGLDTKTADKVLTAKGARDEVQLLEGDSVEQLIALPSALMIDFAYLDSSNDPIRNLAEFELCVLRGCDCFMLDDCDNTGANKGELTVPVMNRLGFFTQFVGGRMMFAVKNRETANYVMPVLAGIKIEAMI
jgi:hypothetical protein